jgi:hypothetical protein
MKSMTPLRSLNKPKSEAVDTGRAAPHVGAAVLDGRRGGNTDLTSRRVCTLLLGQPAAD